MVSTRSKRREPSVSSNEGGDASSAHEQPGDASGSSGSAPEEVSSKKVIAPPLHAGRAHPKKKRKPNVEETNLTEMLFGGIEATEDLFDRGDDDNDMGSSDDEAPLELPAGHAAATHGSDKGEEGDVGFVVDKKPQHVILDDESEDEEDAEAGDEAASDSGSSVAEAQPAWVDPDDGQVTVDVTEQTRLRKLRKTEEEKVLKGKEYQDRLRSRHEAIHRMPTWAQDHGDQGADSDDDDSAGRRLLQTADGLTTANTIGGPLPAQTLHVTRLRDANAQEPSKSVVQQVEFHPNSQLMLTAGYDKRCRLFHIDGKKNAKVQSIFLSDLPIKSAHFSPTGDRIVLSGRRKFFYIYDINRGHVEKVPDLLGVKDKSLESMVMSPTGQYIAFLGNDGHTHLVSSASRRRIASVKMNGSVRSAAFTSDGNYLLTGGGTGDIYTWDMRTRRCVDKQVDEGSTHVSTLTMSSSDALVATGSDSGVVNIYNRGGSSSSNSSGGGPHSLSLRKAFMNLVTDVDTLTFNHDQQLLLASSKMKKDHLRMIHVPTNTVFSNWPTSKTPLHYVTSAAFSPQSGYLAIGNDRGKVLLYKLNHYGPA